MTTKNEFPANKTLRVLVENPKRGKSAQRFDLYKGCRTVGDLLAKYETKKLPRWMCFADLRWDSQHDFISLGYQKPAKSKAEAGQQQSATS